MKMIIYILLILLGSLATLGFSAYGVGFFLPEKHTARMVVELSAGRERVWNRISDMARGPEWRSNLKSAEKRPPLNGNALWRETDVRGDVMDYETTESIAPRKLTRRIASPDLPFGGTWTLELEETSAGGTRLIITEHGEVYNPIFRFVSRFIMGHDATLRAYAKDLQASFTVDGGS